MIIFLHVFPLIICHDLEHFFAWLGLEHLSVSAGIHVVQLLHDQGHLVFQIFHLERRVVNLLVQGVEMIDTNALSIVDIEQGAGPRVLSPNDPFNLLRASRLLVSDFLAQLSVSYLSASLKAVDLLFDVLSDAFPVVRTR